MTACFSFFQVLLPADLWLCVFRQSHERDQDRNLPQGEQCSTLLQYNIKTIKSKTTSKANKNWTKIVNIDSYLITFTWIEFSLSSTICRHKTQQHSWAQKLLFFFCTRVTIIKVKNRGAYGLMPVTLQHLHQSSCCCWCLTWRAAMRAEWEPLLGSTPSSCASAQDSPVPLEMSDCQTCWQTCCSC